MLSTWQIQKGAIEALLEAKDNLIQNLDVSEEQKQELIATFRKYPQLDSKIDWNRKDLTWEDFEEVIDYINFKKETKFDINEFAKMSGVKLIWSENEKYIFSFYTTESAEYLSRHGRGNFMNWEFGYNWCIKNPKIFNNYILDGSKFYLLYGKGLGDYTKTAIYNSEDENLDGSYSMRYTIQPAYSKEKRMNFASVKDLNAHVKNKIGITFQFTEEMFK